MTGFPWYLLAHSQHEFLPIIQITDLGGGFAVSLLVAAVNAFVFDIVWQFPRCGNGSASPRSNRTVTMQAGTC